MRQTPKPKYRLGQTIVGRIDHLAGKDKMAGEVVMVEIESARRDSKYGHWIYCGTLEHLGEFGTKVEIYEWDVIKRYK